MEILHDSETNFPYPKVVSRFDPSRPDFAPYGFTCDLWTPTPMKRSDRHNEIELNLLKTGSLTYLLGGKSVTLEPGRLAVFWAAVPHQVTKWAGQSEYFVATIPLVWFLQRQFPEPFVRAVLHGEVLLDPSSGRAGHDAESFAQWVRDLADACPTRQRAVMLEMESRLLRFALAVPARKASTRRAAPARSAVRAGDLDYVEQMVRFIASHYTEPLTVEEISESTGLHPNYAMSLFRETFGMTLIGCVTQHRLSHAQRLLATTDESVLDVALASGFNSLSRFNDAFKQSCGCSPRQFRQKH